MHWHRNYQANEKKMAAVVFKKKTLEARKVETPKSAM